MGLVDAVAEDLRASRGERGQLSDRGLSGLTLSRLGDSSLSPGAAREEHRSRRSVRHAAGRGLDASARDSARGGRGTRMFVPVTPEGRPSGFWSSGCPTTPTRNRGRRRGCRQSTGVHGHSQPPFTDLFERGQRTVPLSWPAEIQRRVLPPPPTPARLRNSRWQHGSSRPGRSEATPSTSHWSATRCVSRSPTNGPLRSLGPAGDRRGRVVEKDDVAPRREPERPGARRPPGAHLPRRIQRIRQGKVRPRRTRRARPRR